MPLVLIDHPSPNFDDRAGGQKPEILVLHFTGMKDTASALGRLCDPQSKVSSHYLVDEEGKVYCLVDESKRAWHAGVSFWNGVRDVNGHSIGIEISNRDGKPYTPAQLRAVTALCRDVIRRHGIRPQDIVGHSDIAPDRKEDPGAHFPWKDLSAAGVGKWPRPRLADRFNAAAVAKKPKKLRRLFAKAGYGTEAPARDGQSLKQLVMAFQRRYEPETFAKCGEAGKPTAKTVALLRAVARMNGKRH